MKRFLFYSVAALVTLPSLAFLLFGFNLLQIWLRALFGFSFYHDASNYVLAGFFATFPAAIALSVIWRVISRRKSVFFFAIPFFLVLGIAVHLPCFLFDPRLGVALEIHKIGRLTSRWADEHKRLPETSDEIRETQKYGNQETDGSASRYALGNRVVPYEVVIVPHATGPFTDPSQLSRPARIFYSLSEDRQTAWITGTGLSGEFTGKPEFLHDRGNQKGILVDVARPGGHLEFSN